MRLLNASTLALVEKLENDELPPYAILSHTWGKNEDEVTLQEMQHFSGGRLREFIATSQLTKKKGFTKIWEAARLALSQGVGFLWVDTCCIDKTSSAELSEAINSMFRWYQRSQTCYVLLSDVDAVDPQNHLLNNPMVEALRKSRWFQRVWTLQELVAPKVVQFYNTDWTFLGSKSDKNGFQDLVGSITGIGNDVLDGVRPVADLSVANRMQWASARETARPEDLAYCLMGIFGINMPLLYGEGGMKAFLRQEEEILKVTNDYSIFACPSILAFPISSTGLSGLLAPSPACFWNSGMINALSLDEADVSTPSSVTNVGLRVCFNISPADGDPAAFNAILDCAPYFSTTHGHQNNIQACRAAIRLTSLGGNQYARLRSDQILEIPAFGGNSIANTAQEQKEVFVTQQPILLLPDIFLRGLDVVQAIDGYLVATWPHNNWNLTARTMRLGGSQRGGIVAAFRFKITRKEEESSLLDIFVSFSMISVGVASWNTWCYLTESNGEQDLGLAVSSLNSQLMPASNLLHYGRYSCPEIIVEVSRLYKKGRAQIALSIKKIHKVAASVPRLVQRDPKPDEYNRLAARSIFYAQTPIEVDLTNLYSSSFEIRTGEGGDAPNHRQFCPIFVPWCRCLLQVEMSCDRIKRPQMLSKVISPSFSSKLV